VLAILVVIWATNFFIILPRLNLAFVHMMPHAATLASKLLFGIAAAWCFQRAGLIGRTPARGRSG
jgi:hypothetical protein